MWPSSSAGCTDKDKGKTKATFTSLYEHNVTWHKNKHLFYKLLCSCTALSKEWLLSSTSVKIWREKTKGGSVDIFTLKLFCSKTKGILLQG